MCDAIVCLQAILAKLEMNLGRVDQLPWILSWLLRMLSAMTTPLHKTTAQLEVPPIADTLWHSSSDTSTRGSSSPHSHVDKVGALTWVERSGYLQCKKSSPCPKRTRDPTRLRRHLKEHSMPIPQMILSTTHHSEIWKPCPYPSQVNTDKALPEVVHALLTLTSKCCSCKCCKESTHAGLKQSLWARSSEAISVLFNMIWCWEKLAP